MYENIVANLHSIQNQIQKTLTENGLSQDVTVLAVSKKQPIEAILSLADCGQMHFGENKIQEALPKILACPDLIWHFIGPIQSNKAKDIAEHFSFVHSVDRLSIARRLNTHRATKDTPLNICIQVNISNDMHKSGISETELENFITACLDFKHLRIRGLMTILENYDSVLETQRDFQKMNTCFERIKSQFSYLQLDTLSMGMSNDYELAIKEGATLVRIGSALFS